MCCRILFSVHRERLSKSNGSSSRQLPRRHAGAFDDGLMSIAAQLAVPSASGFGVMIGQGFPEVRSGWRGSVSGLP